jgi:hypothetical protein
MKTLDELKQGIKEVQQRKLRIKLECIEDKLEDALINNKKIVEWHYLEGLGNEIIEILKSKGYNAVIKRHWLLFIFKFIRIYL